MTYLFLMMMMHIFYLSIYLEHSLVKAISSLKGYAAFLIHWLEYYDTVGKYVIF